MDRHNRVFAGAFTALVAGLLLSTTGCHSMRNEVPPGRPYSTTGGSPPPLQFGSDPHPGGSAGIYGNPLVPGSSSPDSAPSGPGSTTQFGTPGPASGNYGAPTTNKYGAMPGTLSPAPLNQ
jgi:hypothetical protein